MEVTAVPAGCSNVRLPPTAVDVPIPVTFMGTGDVVSKSKRTEKEEVNVPSLVGLNLMTYCLVSPGVSVVPFAGADTKENGLAGASKALMVISAVPVFVMFTFMDEVVPTWVFVKPTGLGSMSTLGDTPAPCTVTV